MPTSSLVGIRGGGAYFPKEKVKVSEFAQKYNLTYPNVFQDHNIMHFHVASPDEDELFMALRAAHEAVKDSQVRANLIDLVIYCKGITRQAIARPYSNQIIQEIKATGAYGFDIDGGLIGGLIGIQVANDIIKNNQSINNALIVSAQVFDNFYLFGGGASRIRNIVFGDGAAAIMLVKDHQNNTILASDFVIDHNTILIDDLLSDSIKKQSAIQQIVSKIKNSAVGKFQRRYALSKLSERWVENSYQVVESCMKSINLDVTDVNHFIKSQISSTETDMLLKKLNIDKSKIFDTSSDSGHLGNADILYNLHSSLKNQYLKNLDILAVVTANYDCSAGAVILRR